MQFMFGGRKNNCLLNRRSEIVSACQHKNRFQVNNLKKETKLFGHPHANVSFLSIKEVRMFSKFVDDQKILSG